MNDNKQKPKKIRGTMEYYDDDRLLFTPQGTGQPQYESLKKSGGGALMRTTGEKTRSLVAHLKVPADAVDPAADLRDQLEKCLKALPGHHAEPVLKGRKLMATDSCSVTVNQAKGQLEIRMTIGLRENPYYLKNFYTNMTKVSTCLDSNSSFLKPLVHARGTSSGE